jgi:hypothetical protein
MTRITLIIPDIHHKWERAEKIISKVGADEVIFLGDYFDDFGDDPHMVKDTVDWLEASVAKPERIHLFGNHDQHYAFVYKTFQCSGYAQWKYFIVRDNINPKVWDKLKWFHFLDNRWLLSHAGLHRLNVPPEVVKYRKDRKKFIAAITEFLDKEIRKGFQAGAEGVGSWVFNAGHARWGQQRVGGITWCDYTAEFYPVKGINQIVGHTPQQYGVKWCRLTADDQLFHHSFEEYTPTTEILDNPDLSTNVCLDVLGNMHYGIWDGKQLKLGDYKSL